MPNYANAYGAMGAHDALREILADKIAAAKVEEDNRRAKVLEAAEAARMAQQADQFRQVQATHQGEFVSGRDERYQNELRATDRYNREAQTAATDRDISRKDKIDTRADTLADRVAAREERAAEQRNAQDFQLQLQRGAQAFQHGENAPMRAMAAEQAQLKIDAAKQKVIDAATAKTKQASEADTSTRGALASVEALLKDEGGLDMATGAYELRGSMQGAQDWKAERDRLVAMLTLPNLGALKGPMSDKDVAFIKSISTKLQNDKISGDAARTELRSLRDKLNEKLGAAPGAPPPGADAREDLSPDFGPH
jgi:hypothetical protein